LIKTLQGRHSRKRGSPELIDFTGFPLSREWRRRVLSDFLRVYQYWLLIKTPCLPFSIFGIQFPTCFPGCPKNEKAHTLCVLDTVYEPLQFPLVLPLLGLDHVLKGIVFSIRDHVSRPLKNAPFRSLRLSAQSLRCVQILILEIFNILLWLKSSRALILNKIEHFSKVSFLTKNLEPWLGVVDSCALASIFIAHPLKLCKTARSIIVNGVT